MNYKNLDAFLDDYINIKKERFLKDLLERVQNNRNLDVDFKTEDLLFIILIILLRNRVKK